jgi:uncharacterized protein YjbI with pentapeptide repeats
MANKTVVERWKTDSFVTEKLKELQSLSTRADDMILDFQGIPIGQHNSPPLLRFISFAGLKMRNVNFDSATITARFNDAVLSNFSFRHAKLAECEAL